MVTVRIFSMVTETSTNTTQLMQLMQLLDWGFLLLPEFMTKYTFGNQPPIYFPHFTKNLVDVQVAVYHAIVTPKLGNVGARLVSDHNG